MAYISEIELERYDIKIFRKIYSEINPNIKKKILNSHKKEILIKLILLIEKKSIEDKNKNKKDNRNDDIKHTNENKNKGDCGLVWFN